MQAIRELSNGEVPVQSASFYRHLGRLMDDGLVVEIGVKPDGDDPRRGRRTSSCSVSNTDWTSPIWEAIRDKHTHLFGGTLGVLRENARYRLPVPRNLANIRSYFARITSQR